MATTITQSVLAKFPDVLLPAFSASQGLWFGEIPQNFSLPFVGFVHGGERPTYTMEREYQESGTFTFTVFAEGVAETERLALLVMNVYDAFTKHFSQLDFTGGKMVDWERTSYMVSLEPIANVQAKRVARADFQYAYTTQKSLPA